MDSHSFPNSTRRDEVVLKLREEIISGALPPGEVIKDAELAARLGVSITPVREAITLLAVEGLIEMPPKRAKRVSPLTKQSALELCFLMRILSLAAYELGLPRLLFADLTAMKTAHQVVVQALASQDLLAAAKASRTFHDVIIRAAENHELRRMLALILTRFERLLRLLLNGEIFPDEVASEASILRAIEQRDLPAALEIYRASLDGFQRLIEQLPDDPTTPL